MTTTEQTGLLEVGSVFKFKSLGKFYYFIRIELMGKDGKHYCYQDIKISKKIFLQIVRGFGMARKPDSAGKSIESYELGTLPDKIGEQLPF